MGRRKSPETRNRKTSRGYVHLKKLQVLIDSGIYLHIGLKGAMTALTGRVLMYIYDKWLFNIPVYFTVNYISAHLLAETDFVREAINGARMRQYVETEPLLRDKVYIPKVFGHILSPRVMVAEVSHFIVQI